MHIGSSLPAGVRYLIAILLVVVLFLPGTSGANVTPGTTDTLSITPTPSSGSLEGLPLQTATEFPTAPIPHDPPRIENLQTIINGYSTNISGTVLPGSQNTTIIGIEWDWGDNSTRELHEFPHSHTYGIQGTYPISVTAYQSDGQSVTEMETVTIERQILRELPERTNPGPFQIAGPVSQVSAPVLTLLEPVIDGRNVTLNGNLDPGSPGVTISSVSIDWDDGNVTNATTLPATYRYATAGIFTVNITGIQSDGQATTKGITVDIRPENSGPPGTPNGAIPPPDDQPIYYIILVTAVVLVLIVGIGQWLILKKRDESAVPDIPKAVSLQEEMYRAAKAKGDLEAAAASAQVCARMFRSLAEQSPKMRTIYLELAEKWETIAQTTGKTGSDQQHPLSVGPSAERIPSREELEQICAGTDVAPEVVESIIRVAMEIGREGREGQSVGTSFVVGDTDAVMHNSRQFVLNPFHGHKEAERQITGSGIWGNIKEFAQLDGAFIVSGNGVVESAGRYITVDMSQVKIPDGLGSRHSSIAGITMVTSSIGIVVSQSGGLITIFKDGKIVQTIG